MAEEIKRVSYNGLTFRLIYQPDYYVPMKGKRLYRRWVIQTRHGNEGRFKRVIGCRTKKHAMKELREMYLTNKEILSWFNGITSGLC